MRNHGLVYDPNYFADIYNPRKFLLDHKEHKLSDLYALIRPTAYGTFAKLPSHGIVMYVTTDLEKAVQRRYKYVASTAYAFDLRIYKMSDLKHLNVHPIDCNNSLWTITIHNDHLTVLGQCIRC